MGEDQHAAGARRLDEAERGDRLAGAGRVLEPEALGGVGILGLLGELLLVLRHPRRRSSSQSASGASASARSSSASSSAATSSSSTPRPRPRRAGARSKSSVVVVVLVERPRPPRRPRPRPRRRARAPRARLRRRRPAARSSSTPRIAAPASTSTAPPAPLPVPSSLASASSAVERPRQRVDLVGRERRAVGELGLLLGEHPLEAEQQRELAPPGRRGDLGARSSSSSASAWSSARRRGVPGASATRGLLAGVHEGLARELLRARDVVDVGRADRGHWWARPLRLWTSRRSRAPQCARRGSEELAPLRRRLPVQ